ncbi:MAG: hypothetical protein EHM24_01905 [Acidobacteria bacterium]|nr:MAG: hypothetical protein EHM24_01905 [Acidobacteriota bacterium]
MNDAWRSDFERRLRATLSSADGSIPVILGLCGTGRTTVLRRLQEDLGAEACQYVNVERAATTPERFLEALVAASPFRPGAAAAAPTARAAYDAALTFFSEARRADGAPATFLLDGVLEFRTFESFPGLRRALQELLRTLAATPNRFVLGSRYLARASRALAATPPFVVSAMECVEEAELSRMLAAAASPCRGASQSPGVAGPADNLAPLVGRLCAGRPAVVRALARTMAEVTGVTGDPVAALAAGFDADGHIAAICCHTYELRLQRARGYGALKAVLDILAGEEPLTLTEVSQRLGRTPGSTKDYLSWLEDVDLVRSEQKRYRFRDPLLRVWVRLHCRPSPPAPEEIAREVEQYASRVAPAGV